MVRKTKRKLPDPAQIDEAEKQIREYSRTVKFTVVEYSVEFIVQKLNADRYYVPDYQRNLIWKPKEQSKFIESVLMGLPVPFVFFWQDDDGLMEIVDGSQRIRTVRDFMADKITLKGLEALPAANGLIYSDLPPSRQFKFADSSLRVIILANEPAPTMTTQCYGFGNGRFGHPEQDRAISLREAAMLQSFPKTYAFVPDDTRVNFNTLGRMIGNAVPVMLGEFIGEILVEHVQAQEGHSKQV